MCSVGRMSDRICTDFTLEKKKTRMVHSQYQTTGVNRQGGKRDTAQYRLLLNAILAK